MNIPTLSNNEKIILVISTGERGATGTVTPEMIALRDEVQNLITNVLGTIVGITSSMTKAQLRTYTGDLKRIVYLTDVTGKSLAVFRPYDQVSEDNADLENQALSIIIDGAGRRYRLMDILSLFSEFLKSYVPEEL